MAQGPGPLETLRIAAMSELRARATSFQKAGAQLTRGIPCVPLKIVNSRVACACLLVCFELRQLHDFFMNSCLQPFGFELPRARQERSQRLRSSSVWRFENIRRAAAASRCVISKLEVCLNISEVSVHINRVVLGQFDFVLKSLPLICLITEREPYQGFRLDLI